MRDYITGLWVGSLTTLLLVWLGIGLFTKGQPTGEYTRDELVLRYGAELDRCEAFVKGE